MYSNVIGGLYVDSAIVETGGALSSAVYWMRSGALGSSASQTLAWAGDQDVDFSIADGVASTIVAGGVDFLKSWNFILYRFMLSVFFW